MKSLFRLSLRAPSLLCLLLIVILAGSCNRPRPSHHIKESAHPEIASEIKRAIRAAGGSDIWIQHPGGFRRGAPPDNNLQIVAASSVYRDVLSAAREEASKAHLLVSTEASTTPEKLHAATIDVTQRSGTRVMQIRLREVHEVLRAAIVIDDVGNDLEPARELAALEYPITFSVLPYLRFTGDAAKEAHENGHEVMLHLPMEPAGSRISPGKGAILVGMSADDAEKTVEDDLDSVPYVRGVNNHMGSRATTDAALMDAVMKTLARRRLYFIDSRTTASSVALETARDERVPSFYRSVFLDDTESVDYTLGQLRELRRIVEREGVALAIGHPHASTIAALKEFLPEFERADIELVTPSQIVRLPEISKLHPPSHVQASALGSGDE